MFAFSPEAQTSSSARPQLGRDRRQTGGQGPPLPASPTQSRGAGLIVILKLTRRVQGAQTSLTYTVVCCESETVVAVCSWLQQDRSTRHDLSTRHLATASSRYSSLHPQSRSLKLWPASTGAPLPASEGRPRRESMATATVSVQGDGLKTAMGECQQAASRRRS